QAYYHTALTPGNARNGTQNTYSATTTMNWQPRKTVLPGSTGTYTALHEQFTNLPRNTTSDLEHLVTGQWDLPRHFSLRGQLLRRSAKTFTGRSDALTDVSQYL